MIRSPDTYRPRVDTDSGVAYAPSRFDTSPIPSVFPKRSTSSGGVFIVWNDLAANVPVSAVTAPDMVLSRIDRLDALQDGWDGDGAPAPSSASLAVAASFYQALLKYGLPAPLVGPANDGGVVFEWDLSRGRSIYCYARDAKVEVAAFGDHDDYVDVTLAPQCAADIVSALLVDWQ